MIWNAKYETGNTQVDGEHKEIFRLVQGVIDATADSGNTEIESTVDFLANYTINHFNNEEKLMQDSEYPDMPVHKKQHDEFVVEVLALKERLKSEGSQSEKNTDIKKVIVNWLTDHVLGSDRIMADYYRKWSTQ